MDTLAAPTVRSTPERRPLSDPVEPSDGELLRAAGAGDRAALERLLARHTRSLYVLCRGILGQPDDAEDAVQETFLRALRGFSRFRGQAAPRTWLFRIAVNICLEWKRARQPAAPLEDADGLGAPGRVSPEAEALEQLCLMEALAALQPRQRAILILKVVEGWSVTEIAAGMRCTRWRIYHELRIAHRALAEWRRSTEEGG